MKLTSYGMWENNRLVLRTLLLANSKLNTTQEQLDAILLEPVITKYIETVSSFIATQLKTKQPIDTLASYKAGLATILPSLATALTIEEGVIESAVTSFITACLEFAEKNMAFLDKLKVLSELAKTNGIIQLYGEDFAKTYPDLAITLPFNDAEVRKAGAGSVSLEIETQWPDDAEAMKQHIPYMQEIVAQMKPSPNFENDFQKATGKTMQEYKDSVLQSKKPNPLPSLGKLGSFKPLSQTTTQSSVSPTNSFN